MSSIYSVLAEHYEKLAVSLRALDGENTQSDEKSKQMTVPTEQAKPLSAPIPDLAEVRAVLAVKSQEGKLSEVHNVLMKHGAERISEVKPELLASVLADVEAL